MTEERFWSKVNKTDTCWLWTGGCNRGYGRFKINYKLVFVHRYSYILHKGEIAEGLVVRHTCDVSNCVNPDHLLVGTHQDNMNDKMERNRQAKGEICGSSKLTEDDVREIRIFRVFGFTYYELGNMYNVHYSTIAKIITGINWSIQN